eukprot:scaffold130809_cov13-Tisochrysis_lutea.AAC.1
MKKAENALEAFINVNEGAYSTHEHCSSSTATTSNTKPFSSAAVCQHSNALKSVQHVGAASQLLDLPTELILKIYSSVLETSSPLPHSHQLAPGGPNVRRRPTSR